MNITKEMVDEFNKALEILGCVFRLKFGTIKYCNTACEIVLANNRFVKSFIINPTDDFYDILESFFDKKGIKLRYNNNRSVFWNMSAMTF